MQADVARAELSGRGFTPGHQIAAQGQIKASSSGQRNRNTPSLLISKENKEIPVFSTIRRFINRMAYAAFFARCWARRWVFRCRASCEALEALPCSDTATSSPRVLG